MKSHVVVGDDDVGICEPLIERSLVPDNVRGFELVGVAEIGYASRFPAVDVVQAGTFFILVERMAAGASLLEEKLAAGSVSRGSGCIHVLVRRGQESEGQPDGYEGD